MPGTPVELYQYTPVEGVVLAPWEARSVLEAAPGSLVTVDLGLSRARVHRGPEGSLVLESPRLRVEVGEEVLEEAAGWRARALLLSPGGARPLEVRAGRYYKLVPVPGAPPTLEIDGIHMHRILGTDPGRDTWAKIRAARVGRGHRVLDTCMGLGYTAIYSARRGASHVVTIEVDENVVYIARMNPWSRPLESPGIDVVLGDATRVVWELPEAYFDRIIHDPPRLSSTTGDLYGLEFYRRLYQLLRPGGRLFHYTGEPGKKRRLNIPGRVAGRLEKAGFIVLGFDDRAKGVVAVKPR